MWARGAGWAQKGEGGAGRGVGEWFQVRIVLSASLLVRAAVKCLLGEHVMWAWPYLCPLAPLREVTAHGARGQSMISVAWLPPCLGPVAQQPKLRDAGFRLPVETSSSVSGGGSYKEWDPADLGIIRPPCSKCVWTDSLRGVGPRYVFLSQGRFPCLKPLRYMYIFFIFF